MFTKDPNFGVFSDTSSHVTKTYHLDWSRVYSIIDNNDLSYFQSDQIGYERIRDSFLHMIVSRPAILPYNDVVWSIIDHANVKDHSFNTSIGSQLANFCSETFVRIYALKPFTQLLDAYFVNTAKSKFNSDQMLKSWMTEPHKFSKRKDELYPVEWFKEPYSLLAAMLCRLYGLPNFSYFKKEWAPIAHHVITSSESCYHLSCT